MIPFQAGLMAFGMLLPEERDHTKSGLVTALACKEHSRCFYIESN